MSDPEIIYLAPLCCTDPNEGRIWCEHDIWPLDDCESSAGGIQYTRAETPQSIPSERDAIVAWLDDHLKAGACLSLSWIIDAIKAGDHLAPAVSGLQDSQGSGSGASASRQPAGQASPEAPVSAGSSPSGDHQAQGDQND